MPPAASLAAATYRSDLFARAVFTLRDHGWYAAHGHFLLGYSMSSRRWGRCSRCAVVLALSSARGVRAVRGSSRSASSALGRTAPARVAALVFALGFCVGLLTGRVPYDLGLAIGLGRGARAAARTALRSRFVLALLTSAAGPVAGAFLALAGLAYALAEHRPRTGRAHTKPGRERA